MVVQCLRAVTAVTVVTHKCCHPSFRCGVAQYFALLSSCDVAVSTAIHEFFGIAMLEAVSHTRCVCVCLVNPGICDLTLAVLRHCLESTPFVRTT